MVEISLSGSGEGREGETPRGYSTDWKPTKDEIQRNGTHAARGLHDRNCLQSAANRQIARQVARATTNRTPIDDESDFCRRRRSSGIRVFQHPARSSSTHRCDAASSREHRARCLVARNGVAATQPQNFVTSLRLRDQPLFRPAKLSKLDVVGKRRSPTAIVAAAGRSTSSGT